MFRTASCAIPFARTASFAAIRPASLLSVASVSRVSCLRSITTFNTDPFNLSSNPSQAQNSHNDDGLPSRGRREQGTVKWFDRQKGYGFITRESGPDLFVHFSAVKGEMGILQEGQKVSFSVGSGRKGKGEIAQEVSIPLN